MLYKSKAPQIIILLILISGISLLHYFTQPSLHHYHIFFRELYFLPLILAGFWLGLPGALTTSLTITAIYLPFTLIHWEGLSPDDFNRLIEIVLYNVIAAVSGILRDRAKAREKERLDAVLALAGSVAHELNTPLFTALGTTQLLQQGLDPGSEGYNDSKTIIKNLKHMNRLIKQISKIDHINLKDYVGSSQIIDIEKSSNREQVISLSPYG